MAALVRFPFFFHTQPVRVRGKASETGCSTRTRRARVWLVAGGTATAHPGGDAEVTGLTSTSDRLGRTGTRSVPTSGPLASACCRDWPAPGELRGGDRRDTAVAAEPMNAPLGAARNRAIPAATSNRKSRVVGRFRRQNLCGDARSVGTGRYDFVLQSADKASIWVTGRPRRGAST